MSEEHTEELLSVLSRIARSLERIASVVDGEENELQVYVRGEVNLNEDESLDDEDDADDEEFEDEYEEEEETTF